MAGVRADGWDDVADYAGMRLASTFGRAASASGIALHPTRDVVAAAGEVRDSLLAPPRSVITLFEAGEATELREGWAPAWSPDGSVLAHLDAAGVQIGELHRAVDGAIERLAWKQDGTALLLVVAEPRAELPGVAGSGLVAAAEGDTWTPSVASSTVQGGWRRLVVLDAMTGALTPVGRADLNVWKACWAGDLVLALCSDGDPTESAWYSADLRIVDPRTGTDEVVATPSAQVGAIAASASGRRIAYAVSIASDRDLIAGDLVLLDLDTSRTTRLAAPNDVSAVAFISEDELGFAGLEGLTTRVGLVGVTGEVTVLWEALDRTTAGVNPDASFRPGAAAFLTVGHSAGPEVLLVKAARPPVVVRSLLDNDEATRMPGISRVHRWTAADGLEIEGWLHLPEGPGPHPLVAFVHGGPVHSYRASWGPTALLRPLLIERGYAVLVPNVRGSSGRGQDFARAVVGDMGGADAQDVIAGVRSLVAEGLADEARIGVTGGSYGGFLSAWLVTQTDLFAAAVASHPITDWVHQHGVSSIPLWDELFLDGKPYATDGQYVTRSPITYADRVTTPTLFIAGTLDRATPAGQALAMQRALAARGVPSECVTYPLAAHGARDMPSVLDVLARTLAWFERWMPATAPTGEQ